MVLVFVQIKQVIIAVAVLVGIDPLVGVEWVPITFIRPAVAVKVGAAKAVFGGRTGRVGASIGFVGWRWVITESIGVRVVPLRPVGREGVHDAIALVGGVVAVVVFVDVSEPVVDALVVSTVGRDDVGRIGAPCNTVHNTALVVVSGGAAAGTRAAEGIDLDAGVGVVHSRRGTVSLVPVHG